MSKQKRRRFTAEMKAEVVRRAVFKKEKVSDLADEYGIQPSLIYGWLRQAEVNLAQALESESASRRQSSREQALEAEVGALKERLSVKDGVIVELTEEYVNLKKTAGDS